MNNLVKVGNVISTILIILGVFSKHLHYPGAAIEIILATVLVIMFVLMDCIIKKDKINLLIGLSLCIMFLGALFKAQHWVGANAIAGLGVGLSIVIAFLLSLSGDKVHLSQQNGLSIFLLLIFVSTLMANNPIKQMLNKDEIENTVSDSTIHK